MWLYVPKISTSSPSVPEAPALISASSWQFQALERSVWWRGKPFQSRHWFQRWNKVSFIRLLCGAMPEPSMAAHGVAQWTASLAASRASLTASPAASREATTPETSGPRRAASLSSQPRGSSSSRTSAACSRRGLTKSLARSAYSETFQSLVSRLREDCSRRQKLARATSASASSSLAYWMTPRAGENDEPVEAFQARRMRMDLAERIGVNGTLSIQAKEFQASAWPTPTANDWKGSGPTLERKDGQMRGDRLDYATEQFWYTPNVPNGGRTLGADTGPTGITKHGIKRQVGLENQANWWMTPRSHEVGQYQYSRGDRDKPVQTLTGQAFSLRDQTSEQNGAKSSPDRRSLNPLFVEWLMGWPPGWTLAAWTDFACSETALSLFKQHMRSALFSRGLPREAPPAQLALFG